MIQGASFKDERTLDLNLEGHTQSHPTCIEVGYQSRHHGLTAQHTPGALGNTARLDHGIVAKTLSTSLIIFARATLPTVFIMVFCLFGDFFHFQYCSII